MPILLRLPAAALILSLGAAQHLSVESRTLAPTVPAREGVSLIMNQRIVSDGTVLLISRGVQPDGSVYAGVGSVWRQRVRL